jgi:hypothetical protein
MLTERGRKIESSRALKILREYLETDRYASGIIVRYVELTRQLKGEQALRSDLISLGIRP